MNYRHNQKIKKYKIQENFGENLNDLVFGNEFLDTTHKAQYMTEKLLSWTALKLKTEILKKTLLKETRLEESICETHI